MARGKLLKYEKKEIKNVENGYVEISHYIYHYIYEATNCEVYRLYGDWALNDDSLSVDIKASKCIDEYGITRYSVEGEIAREELDYYYRDTHFKHILEYTMDHPDRAKKAFEIFREIFNKLPAGGEG